MFSKLSLLTTLLQVSLAAAGNAVISNRCSYDIWVWSVGQGVNSAAIHVPARTQYSEPIRSSTAGGVSFKMSKTSTLVGGAQTQFEYTVTNNQLWYDISFVDCASGQNADKCPGHDMGLAMAGSQSACGQASCQAGSYCPSAAYYCPQPLQTLGIAEPVFTCPGAGLNVDLKMTVCSSSASNKRSVAGRVLIDAE